MAMLHARAGDEDRRPAAAPRRDIPGRDPPRRRARSISLHAAQRQQLRRIVQRAAAAAVEHVAAVLAGDRADRSGRENRWAASCAITALPVSSRRTPGGKKICAVAQNRSGTRSKAARSAPKESGLHHHVVIQQADVRVARPPDAAIHRRGEGERLGTALHRHRADASQRHRPSRCPRR